jgi:hypothetical protein
MKCKNGQIETAGDLRKSRPTSVERHKAEEEDGIYAIFEIYH